MRIVISGFLLAQATVTMAVPLHFLLAVAIAVGGAVVELPLLVK